jgi:hypothetical protein
MKTDRTAAGARLIAMFKAGALGVGDLVEVRYVKVRYAENARCTARVVVIIVSLRISSSPRLISAIVLAPRGIFVLRDIDGAGSGWECTARVPMSATPEFSHFTGRELDIPLLFETLAWIEL